MSWVSDYKKSLKMKEVEEIFDLALYRPLGFILVKSILRTRITPNHLTYLAIVMGVIAGCFYSQGTQSCFITGGIFYLLFNVLDCSDGQLARLKKNGTHVGRIIDGLADYTAVIAVFIGVGIGFAAKSNDPVFWWAMLALAGASNIMHSVLVDYYRNRFLDYVLGRKNMFEEDLEDYKKEYDAIKDDKSKWLTKFIISIYLKYMKFQGSLTAKKKDANLFNTTKEEYFKKNKNAIRLWVLLGPTSQITVMIVCAMFMRVDIFCWIMMIGFNAIAAIAWVLQKNIDKSFNKVSE
jgi:phosphatidylglycerophosphate synthase